jgi:hypothetical protein
MIALKWPLGFKTLPIPGHLENLLLPLYFGGNVSLASKCPALKVGMPVFFILALWNIGILLHKQATLGKNFCPSVVLDS